MRFRRQIRLGFHLSIQGSASNSALEAMENNYGAFQLFVTNPRSWQLSEIRENDARLFKEYVRKADSVPFAHMPYLCNPSSPRSEIHKKSVLALKGNMHNCEALGVKCLVVHIGSHLGSGIDAAMKNLHLALNEALNSNKATELLLENSSGYNNSVGSDFREIGRIIDSVNDKRLNVCLDTCHAFAYGYDIRTRDGTSKMMEAMETHIGLERIKLLHLNDSMYDFASKRDRHENIGKGFIGMKGFIEFFKSSKLQTECIVMETPEREFISRKSDMRSAEEIINKAYKGISQN